MIGVGVMLVGSLVWCGDMRHDFRITFGTLKKMPSVAGAFASASCRLTEPWGISSRRTLVSGLMCSRGATPVVSSSPSFSTNRIIRCRSFLISSFSVALNSRRARLERLSINASLTSMQMLWDKNSYLRASVKVADGILTHIYGKKDRNRHERYPANGIPAPG